MNNWRKSHAMDDPEDIVGITTLSMEVRVILNKLKPQNFETSVEQIKCLDIKTEKRLNIVTDLVIDKAVDVKNCALYARLCKQLALMEVPLDGNPEIFKNFRKILLTKCQTEFEQSIRDEIIGEDQLKEIETLDSGKIKEFILAYEEKEERTKRRRIGMVRLIGELFKLNMLVEPVIHESIKLLMTQGGEASLECLSELLKTVGKDLDEKGNKRSTGKNPMDVYLAQIKQIVDRRLTSSRVRFILQDVLDLKKNNWVPRSESNSAMTAENNKQAMLEAQGQQQLDQIKHYSNRRSDEREYNKGKDMNTESKLKKSKGKGDGIRDKSNKSKQKEDGIRDKSNKSKSNKSKQKEDGIRDKSNKSKQTEDGIEEKPNKAKLKENDACCTKRSEEKGVIPAVTDSEKLMQDMEALFLSGKDSDMTLIVQDEEFRVHRAILRARSPVLDAMFSNDMVETFTGILTINDFEPDLFHDFLLYLYSGKVKRLSSDSVIGLYLVANQYNVRELSTKCVEFMKENLTVGMFCKVVCLSIKHKEASLLEAATEFFIKNMKEIIITVEWQIFMKENPTEANEFHIKASPFYVAPVKF